MHRSDIGQADEVAEGWSIGISMKIHLDQVWMEVSVKIIDQLIHLLL